MAIISLTSIPPRFAGLPDVLNSLITQSADIEEVRLYLPKSYKRFPEWGGAIPNVPSAVRVIRVEQDFGPASKVLHAARDLRGTSTPILFCDDDRIYPENWAEGLLRAHRSKPNCCIALHGRHLHQIIPGPPLSLAGQRAIVDTKYFDPIYRWQRSVQKLRKLCGASIGPKPPRGLVPRSGYSEILLGYAGVLVLPDFFDDQAFDIPDDIWMVDDIWLSGNLARLGIPIWLPQKQKICRKAGNDPVDALRDKIFAGDDRDHSNRKAIRYFQEHHGVWKIAP